MYNLTFCELEFVRAYYAAVGNSDIQVLTSLRPRQPIMIHRRSRRLHVFPNSAVRTSQHTYHGLP